MIIFIETRKNNTIIKIEIKVWRRANMDEKKFAIKETVSAEEVKMLRKKLGLTQRDFAGVSYRITCNNGNQRTLINP